MLLDSRALQFDAVIVIAHVPLNPSGRTCPTAVAHTTDDGARGSWLVARGSWLVAKTPKSWEIRKQIAKKIKSCHQIIFNTNSL